MPVIFSSCRATLTRLSVCLSVLRASSEHAGHRHAAGEEADAALQQREGGRDAGVLRAGERRGRAQQAQHQATPAAGQSAGLPPVRVLQGGEEPAGLRVSRVKAHRHQLMLGCRIEWERINGPY